jgi:hypothetical protein
MNMKYYHYLDLNWIEVSKKIKNFSFEVKNSSWGTTTTMGWFNFDIQKLRPDLYNDITQMLSPLNARITSFSLRVHRQQFPVETPHIDYRLDNLNNRILLPVLNTESSITKIYRTTSTPILRRSNTGVPYYYLDPKSCIQVDEFVLDKPVTFRMREPHAVTITDGSNVPRISCPLSVDIDLSYLL